MGKSTKNRSRQARNVVSLFSGAMGLDLGLEQAGFKTSVVLEINKAAIETIKANRPDLPRINDCITETSTAALLEKAGLEKEDVTVVAGGPCCQSFSTAGKRHSLSDPRGSLFREFCRVVKDVRPRFFVMENVKGILSAAVKHRPLNERGPGFAPLSPEEELGSGLKVILKELAALNYYVVYGLLNAADFGVPQNRWRVFFIGSRDGEDIYIPRPSHRNPDRLNGAKRIKAWVTLEDALEGVEPKNWVSFTEERLQLLTQLTEGQNWRDLPKRFHRKALGAALESWGGRAGFCRRLSWDQPAPTLTTAPDGRATTLCHPTENRPLSVEEYAVLQEFPGDWKFSGSLKQQYTQIGNAVPVGLGAAIGWMLRRVMYRTDATGRARPKSRTGLVVCGDPNLQVRLENRKKTQLNPPHMRKNPSIEAARKWLASSG